MNFPMYPEYSLLCRAKRGSSKECVCVSTSVQRDEEKNFWKFEIGARVFEMYHVKPFYDSNDVAGIDTGNVMYAMRPVYGTPVANAQEGSGSHKMDPFSRQERLISSLEQQVRRVDELLAQAKVDAGTCAKLHAPVASSPGPAIGASALSKINVVWPEGIFYPLDIVVQTDPLRLPVTPWALQKLLGKDHVAIHTHVHSTFTGAIPSVENDNADTRRTNSSLKIIFTVIFRNVAETEFMVDPVAQTGVTGEANLFRYICRAFSIFPALSPFEETSSDHYVDLIFANIVAGKSKERQAALKTIDEQIAKKGGRHFICEKVTPADFCLHAALQKAASKDVPGNVLQWRKSLGVAF